jgi:PAS domain S-box-containing protein
MEAAYKKIIDLAAQEYLHCSGLPFPVYLVSKDGIFLRYNEEGRAFFQLPPEPSCRDNVADFYIHAGDREENLHRLYQLEKGQWLKNTIIDMKVAGEVKHVRDYTKAIWDEDHGSVIGLLCLMVNMSKGDRYNQLFNGLPVGIFSFRNEAGLVSANSKFLELHGYSSLEEVRGKTPDAFVRNPSELQEMQRRLFEEGRLTNQYIEHVKRDGPSFTASVTAKAVRGSDGRYIGYEGILEDVSTEAIYFELVDDVPVGLYKIRFGEGGEHLLAHCNQYFARNRGAEPGDLIGQDMRRFMPAGETPELFRQELARAGREGRNLVDYHLEAYDGQGALRKYEVHAKALLSRDGDVVGVIGAERDVTDYWEAKQQLEELTIDIGKVLHSYTSTLIHSKHTMDAVIRSFATPELQEEGGQLNEDKILENIRHHAGLLFQSLDKALDNEKVVGRIGPAAGAQVRRLIDLVMAPKGNTAVQQLALMRDGVIKIKEIVQEMEKGNMPRELSKQIKREIDDILRLSNLATLSRGVDNILEMETVVNNLRSFILTRVRHKESMRRLDIYDMILGVARNMEEFATNRNVELRLDLKEIRDVYIDAYETDLSRALLNIVHNAVKYSWSRRSGGGAGVYVLIEGKKDNEWLYLNIENWGVPITEKELQEGLIFKVGYRGINSSDRRRPGTGLGLYDARRVIEKHNGKINITSEPSLGNARDNYSNPFITTVSIKLPRNHQL